MSIDHEQHHREMGPTEVDASEGYEKSDIGVKGIIVFLVALTIMVGATGALVYGIGKILNERMLKQDGPVNRWSKRLDVRDLGNLPTSPELQQKTNAIVQQYPSPRLQRDPSDGAEDLMALHQREDLLLEHYSWVDESKGKVRIPIDRAMDLIAAKGLPVAPGASASPLLAGDEKIVVTKPLTNGFARTGYELSVAQRDAVDAQRDSVEKPGK